MAVENASEQKNVNPEPVKIEQTAPQTTSTPTSPVVIEPEAPASDPELVSRAREMGFDAEQIKGVGDDQIRAMLSVMEKRIVSDALAGFGQEQSEEPKARPSEIKPKLVNKPAEDEPGAAGQDDELNFDDEELPEPMARALKIIDQRISGYGEKIEAVEKILRAAAEADQARKDAEYLAAFDSEIEKLPDEVRKLVGAGTPHKMLASDPNSEALQNRIKLDSAVAELSRVYRSLPTSGVFKIAAYAVFGEHIAAQAKSTARAELETQVRERQQQISMPPTRRSSVKPDESPTEAAIRRVRELKTAAGY